MTEKAPVRLGLNVDHVATLRNARRARYPDPLRAARIAIEAGADSITAHLREDRRHIRDDDIRRLKEDIEAPLNLEMAATEEMIGIAIRTMPHACCLVPERREEITTEGGLDVGSSFDTLVSRVKPLVDHGIRVSLFIDPDCRQIDAAFRTGAPVVEFHTGKYCNAWLAGEMTAANHEFRRLVEGAHHAADRGLEVHAGHGLDFDTAAQIASILEIRELNIGHFLIGEAIFLGLREAIARMRQAILSGVAHRPLRQQQQQQQQ
jgi:pyridoxine 5-phosphate synthase